MPDPELTEAELSRCFTAVRDLDPPPDQLVASGSLPPGLSADTYSRGTEAARAVGARDILDPSGAALQTAVDAGWYLLKPHLRELEQLSDAALKRDDDRIDAARDCIARGWCEVMVVSMGASEALLVTADEAEHIRSPTVPVESRVGVGHGMVAGIPLALARGRAIETAA